MGTGTYTVMAPGSHAAIDKACKAYERDYGKKTEPYIRELVMVSDSVVK